jgi:hypothetical protein
VFLYVLANVMPGVPRELVIPDVRIPLPLKVTSDFIAAVSPLELHKKNPLKIKGFFRLSAKRIR